ncbi:MAG TPA: AsmA family protein [Candidatus Sulfotelmatobacter sp.]|nr:AsmA family protein [Candidatus Sulfotelmatobacter sp.]
MTVGAKRNRWRYWRIGWRAGVAAALLGLATLVVLRWDWNWFRPLLEYRIAAEIDRPVTLGHFDIQDILSGRPRLVFDGIAVGNPPDFPAGSEFGSIDELSLRIDLAALWQSRGAHIVVPEIAIEHPKGDLRPGPKGNPNWDFGLPSSSSAAGGATALPDIGALSISDGTFRFADPRLKADFTVAVHTEAGQAGHEDRLLLKIKGTYAGQPITADFTGGTLLSLRDPSQPYPIDLRVANGATRVHLKGTVQDPMKFAGANLQLELGGNNLADLYPLTGIPLAPTPPFHLVGHLDYTNRQIRFRHFAGTVGKSDLEGEFDVERNGRARPLVTANLTSRSVVFADLAGFIGSTPGEADAANDTAKLKQERAAEAARQKVIPDVPIDLPKLKVADFKVNYFGQHLQSASTPFDEVRANLAIDDGKVSLTPLSFGIGKSAISAVIHLDPDAKGEVHADAEVDFHHLDLSRILKKVADLQGSGLVDGSMRIKGAGNSLAAMLASGSGGLQASMGGGDVRALLVDLAGLDLGSALFSWMGLPDRTRLRCMVADFGLERGELKARTLLLDTTEANIFGTGGIDLKDETLGMEITTRPKHASFGRLPLPIEVTGTLKKPSLAPGLKVVDQGDLASTLLSFLTIQLGQGEDHDCAALLHKTKQAEAATTHAR